MNIQSKKGFSLPEILVALTIIGLLVTLSVGAMKNTTDDSQVIVSLNQMNSIREAAALFYKDFGCIPEEIHGNAPLYYTFNMNPEYTTRFLCLSRDCSDSEIIDNFANSFTYLNRHKKLDTSLINEDFRPGCFFMFQSLDKLNSERVGNLDYNTVKYLITDPVYSSRSWTASYLEANSQFDATALNQNDDTHYPYEFYSDAYKFKEDVFLPVISTPWAANLESEAMEAEVDAPDLAAKLRKGKYYQILVYSRNTRENNKGAYWIQVPETAVVISRGPDGLPGADGDDETVGAEDYWAECAAMSQSGPTNEQRQCFDRLMITDRDDPDYVNIGDDMVLFIFGGGTVRSPLDR